MNRGDRAALANSLLEVEIEREGGRFSVSLRDGSPVVVNAVALSSCSGHRWQSTDAAGHTLAHEAVSDAIGEGTRAVLTSVDGEGRFELRTLITVYDGLAGFTVEAILKNADSEPVSVEYLSPCQISLEAGAALCPPRSDPLDISNLRALTNGYMYSDPGRVESIGSARRIQSKWNMAIAHLPSQQTLVAGYISHDVAETEISIGYDLRVQPLEGTSGLDFEARSLFGRNVIVPPGEELSSDVLAMTWAGTSDAALKAYGALYARRNRINRKPPLMGWCSWYYTYHKITEGEVLENARFIAEHLRDYGLDVVQIDDGYQRHFGDWEGNAQFPHGMAWLAEQIRNLGLRAGIWLAPYVIDADSAVAKDHPDWLGRGLDGEVKRSRNRGPINKGRGEYTLDVTHPEAQAWLHDLFRRIGPEWGYDVVKLDFVEWSLLAIDRYHDPTIGRAGAYRQGLSTIRHAIGSERHIIDCGPLTASGICDSWRIERDYDRLTWRQYTKELNSNAPAIAKRYYFHNQLWSNDPDHLGLALLTEDQGRAAASIIALSGGTIISGDRLYALPDNKLRILKSVLPAFGEAAVPLDLFDTDFPGLFHLPIERTFGRWDIVGSFNWSETAWTSQRVPLSRLGLDPAGDYLAHEFWMQRVLPVVEGSLAFDLPPASCAVIAVRSRSNVPDLVGTDRHVFQGAVEVANLCWDASRLKLAGTLNGVAGTRPTLTISVPSHLAPREAGVGQTSIPLNDVQDRLLRVPIPTSLTAPTDWYITFERFHG